MPYYSPTHTETCRKLVRERSGSINQKTLLATDYLNHFNEVVMILDLLASMPECIDEAQAWRPKSYIQHFEDSGFPEKALAILAYEQAPPARRVPFDTLIAEMNGMVLAGVLEVGDAIKAGDDDLTHIKLKTLTDQLREMIGAAGGIINGDDVAGEKVESAETSSGFADNDASAADDGGESGADDDDGDGEKMTMDQDSIDSLFD